MRRSLVLLSLILIPAALAPSVYAAKGNGSLSGTVMAADGKGLFGAVIALFKQEAGSAVISLTKSDPKGSYVLSEIAPGSYSLRVTRNGYQVVNSPSIAITTGKNTGACIHDTGPGLLSFETIQRSCSNRHGLIT